MRRSWVPACRCRAHRGSWVRCRGASRSRLGGWCRCEPGRARRQARRWPPTTSWSRPAGETGETTTTRSVPGSVRPTSSPTRSSVRASASAADRSATSGVTTDSEACGPEEIAQLDHDHVGAGPEVVDGGEHLVGIQRDARRSVDAAGRAARGRPVPSGTRPRSSITASAASRWRSSTGGSSSRSALPTTAAVRPASRRAVPRRPTSVPYRRSSLRRWIPAAPICSTSAPSVSTPNRRWYTSRTTSPSNSTSGGNARAPAPRGHRRPVPGADRGVALGEIGVDADGAHAGRRRPRSDPRRATRLRRPSSATLIPREGRDRDHQHPIGSPDGRVGGSSGRRAVRRRPRRARAPRGCASDSSSTQHLSIDRFDTSGQGRRREARRSWQALARHRWIAQDLDHGAGEAVGVADLDDAVRSRARSRPTPVPPGSRRPAAPARAPRARPADPTPIGT